MGSSSTKDEQEEENNQNKISPLNAARNSKSPSPRISMNEEKYNKGKKNNENHYNQAELQGNNEDENQYRLSQGDYSPEGKNDPPFFSGWDKKFHSNDKIQLKIHILGLEPAYQLKNLKKKQSQHLAELSWEYEYLKKNGSRTFLRFSLDEDGGYNKNFLINEQGTCVEGDSIIWSVIAPFRQLERTEMVGGFACERIYESNEENIETEAQEALDSEVYYKWGEKPIVNRVAMKRLLKKKRQIEKLKSQKGFEYSETAKYFTSNDEWTFSVLIEQKFNTFKSWIVELDSSGNKKQAERSKMMSATLKNDVSTREAMYIEEMKKKRNIIKQTTQRQP